MRSAGSAGSTSKTPFYAGLAVIALVGIGSLAYIANRPKAAATTVVTLESVPIPCPAHDQVPGEPWMYDAMCTLLARQQSVRPAATRRG